MRAPRAFRRAALVLNAVDATVASADASLSTPAVSSWTTAAKRAPRLAVETAGAIASFASLARPDAAPVRDSPARRTAFRVAAAGRCAVPLAAADIRES